MSITPPAERFITQPTHKIMERFDDAHLRIDSIHWLAACLSDDYRGLWDALDINYATGEGAVSALGMPERIDNPEDFGEWIHDARKYGWLVLGSSPVPQVSGLRENGEPLIMVSWGFYTNFVAYADLLDDALEDLFAQVAASRSEDIDRQVAALRESSDG